MKTNYTYVELVPLSIVLKRKENKMITKRTLEKWRREALLERENLSRLMHEDSPQTIPVLKKRYDEFLGRLDRLTQAMIDLALTRERR